MNGKLLRPKTVARRYNVHKDTVLDWLRTGQLESVQHDGKWFVSEDALDSYMGDGIPLRASDIFDGALSDRWQWLSDVHDEFPYEKTLSLQEIVEKLTAIQFIFASTSKPPDLRSAAVQSLALWITFRLEEIIEDQSR